jgi:hypothetical protein
MGDLAPEVVEGTRGPSAVLHDGHNFDNPHALGRAASAKRMRGRVDSCIDNRRDVLIPEASILTPLQAFDASMLLSKTM